MRDRVNLWLAVLCLIGTGCILAEIVANWAAWPQAGNVLRAIALPAIWSYVVGMAVQKALRADASHPAIAPVSQHWLPEVVGIDLSPDLLPEFTPAQEKILDTCKTLRLQQGIQTPIFRIRDDMLLASRSYAISVNGIRISGATVDPSGDLQDELSAALKAVWIRYADAIRFFADLRARNQTAQDHLQNTAS